MFCKGEITLYSWDYKVLVSGNYTSKKEVILLVEKWSERYLSQAHHFIIRPLLKEHPDSKYKRGPYKKKAMQAKQQTLKDPIYVPDQKIDIVRPKAIYTNSRSPYGISDKLKGNKLQ